MTKGILCVALFLALIGSALAQAGLVKEILVTGNKQVTREAILSAMGTKVGQQFSATTLDQDKRRLEDLGFFQAVDTQARLLDDGSYQVIVNVSEFQVIREIRIVGNTVVPKDEILKAIPLKQGQLFNSKALAPTARAIQELYSKRGYFTNIEDLGPLAESPQILNISLVEARVNSIKVLGLTRTRESVIRRLLRTRPGDILSLPKWERDVGRVFYSSQWFETVDPKIEPSDEIGKYDLIVAVKEGRTGQFNFGVQLDPRSNLAGLLRLSDTNFRGTGQSIGINFLQATTGSGASLDINYSNPVIDDRGSLLSASAYSRVLYRFAGLGFGGGGTPTDDNRYTERRTGGSIGFSRPFKEDTLVAGLSLRAENIRTEDLTTNTGNDFIQQDGDVAILAGSLTMNRRDVDLDPSRGSWARLLIEPGYSNITRVGGQTNNSDILGSNTFLRNSIEYRAYLSPGPPRGLKLDEPRRVFALRARYGMITGKVPFFEQFFVGGSDSLRGYSEDRFWGKNMIALTAEYRHPIQKSFNAIAFVDWGGAWGGYGSVNTFTQSSTPRMHLGYGLGLSFRTPLGPIRIDYGFNENGGSRTHLLIGTSF